MDIRDIANDPIIAKIWIQAIDETITEFREEGSSGWNDPTGFEPFLAKIAELKKLVRRP